jgi:hypothetical protein
VHAPRSRWEAERFRQAGSQLYKNVGGNPGPPRRPQSLASQLPQVLHAPRFLWEAERFRQEGSQLYKKV